MVDLIQTTVNECVDKNGTLISNNTQMIKLVNETLNKNQEFVSLYELPASKYQLECLIIIDLFNNKKWRDLLEEHLKSKSNLKIYLIIGLAVLLVLIAIFFVIRR